LPTCATTHPARRRGAAHTSRLADLATICANQIQPTGDMPPFTKVTSPTALQWRAFQLLDVSHRLRYT
jgi:hypothetical protein